MRTHLLLVLCAFFLAVTFAAEADEPNPSPKPSIVMEKKTEYSQDMLKALMNDDFDRLERDVKLMQVFTRLEEMYRAKTPGYQEQLTKFRNSVTALSKSVEEKNQEGASQAYVDMVQSCIRCHRIIRNP
jgi:hypothetical protein